MLPVSVNDGVRIVPRFAAQSRHRLIFLTKSTQVGEEKLTGHSRTALQYPYACDRTAMRRIGSGDRLGRFLDTFADFEALRRNRSQDGKA